MLLNLDLLHVYIYKLIILSLLLFFKFNKNFHINVLCNVLEILKFDSALNRNEEKYC